MTADQMPDKIKLGMAFTTKNNKRSCYVVGFVVGGNPLFRFDDDMSFSSLELSMVVRDEKHDICDFFPQNTRATPPKSQGIADAVQTVKDMIAGGGIHETEVSAIEVIIAEATRQHPTPAQAQGEIVTAKELADKVRRVFSMWSDKDGEDSHDYVILKQCLEWATANGYTIIKRTE